MSHPLSFNTDLSPLFCAVQTDTPSPYTLFKISFFAQWKIRTNESGAKSKSLFPLLCTPRDRNLVWLFEGVSVLQLLLPTCVRKKLVSDDAGVVVICDVPASARAPLLAGASPQVPAEDPGLLPELPVRLQDRPGVGQGRHQGREKLCLLSASREGKKLRFGKMRLAKKIKIENRFVSWPRALTPLRQRSARITSSTCTRSTSAPPTSWRGTT